MGKSLILSQSGLSSISQKDIDVSPYFPHKYRDYDREYPNKWTGNREWNANFSSSIPLNPTSEKGYYPRWGGGSIKD